MTGRNRHDDELDRERRDADAHAGVPASVEAFHLLAAAYALDALDADEHAEFERALATSPELRSEVDAYAVTAVHLAGLAEPVVPPSSLRDRLMAGLDDASRLPAADAAPAPSGVAPAPEAAPTPEAAPAGPAASAARRRWFQRTGPIIAAAAAAVVLIAGVVIGVGWPGPNGWGAQREMAAIASAPDAQTQTHEVGGGGEITLVSSAEQGRSAVVVEGLPDVGADRTYELWYIDDAGAAPAGTFDVSGDEAWRILDGSFKPGVAVGITVEPAGGSPQPTTEPIVVIPT
jgi:anti-sigma-K factor RskA